MFRKQPSTQSPLGFVRPAAQRIPAILLVEDEPTIMMILHRLMRDLINGYDIVTMSGGEGCMAQIALRPVPLVITDYNMPGINGIDLTCEIKRISPMTRVVLITAYATPELERQAQRTGVDYYVPKPFQLDQLIQIARDTLL
jgi:two-component system response regulator (stage 0 sporulation protein F)